MTENINLYTFGESLEMCLKEVSNIGSTTYMNICDGTSSVVAWGSADWFLLGVLIVSVILLITLVVKIMKD